MASGREMISTSPSTSTQSPEKLSVDAHHEAHRRRRVHRGGDRGQLGAAVLAGRRQHRPVVPAEELPGLLRWHGSGAVQPEAAAELVLVHNRGGGTMGQAMLIGQPMSSFFTAQERRPRL